MEQNTHIKIDNLNHIKINKIVNVLKQNVEKQNIKYKNEKEKEINKLHLDYLNNNKLNKYYFKEPKRQGYIDYKSLFNKVYIPKNENDYTPIKKINPIKISIKDKIDNIFINDTKKSQNIHNINKEKIRNKILNLNLVLSKELFDNYNKNYNKQIKYKNHLKTDRIIYNNSTIKKYKNNCYLPNIINKRNDTYENRISNNAIFKNPLLRCLNRNNSK